MRYLQNGQKSKNRREFILSFWNVREKLSRVNRLRRSYYELLRDDLDEFMLDYALVKSCEQFATLEKPYPFVEKRELKPRARIPGVEYECHNPFLVIFVEDIVPNIHKKYIRFFDVNKPTKTNLIESKSLILPEGFDRNHRYIDSVRFYDFLKILLPVDYALLIQRDPASKSAGRYALTHYHVRIDWPIAEAAEDLAKDLRYISKDLYEKGDKYAEVVQRKFFEHYGMPTMIGGRRTAAMVAAQYLKRVPCISTVYASSSESRALTRISEQGIFKSVLMKLSDIEIKGITEAHDIAVRTFRKKYVITKEGKNSICIFRATYVHASYARPPDDGKLREIKPDVHWLTVGDQHIIPKPGVRRYPPLDLNYIYS